ncbi:glycoside hydrolase family 99-like domain-containing protein [Lacrimispora saccharolytica]|uniref:glycosyltransferase WbsX family protein n=1 Tax=Lacrimispora saccharolytica TaxID=84030 RepID=UPI00265D2C6F|nr:glycoside hydrolase family 99-like domain-containing protein [Lacrimispora saccharolytica]MCF2657077.1 glycoside hydrolase family 99-like domain-containing protein [Lacrimispora saccharolytica]
MGEKKTKIICFYLPQFHEIEENNLWWGKGYTDWIATKKATSLFKGHNQPRVPLDNNYYNLSDESARTIKWQAELAKAYGIYGFCIYHYWFAGKKLLEKPVEILRAHAEIEIKYTLCWDSKTWKRTWYSDEHEQEILIEQDYGNEEMWKNHFYDLLYYFTDERYIKLDNRPVFHIYQASKIPCLFEMMKCWNELAKQNGFKGMYIVAGGSENRNDDTLLKSVDAFYNFEPTWSFYKNAKSFLVRNSVIIAGLKKRANKLLRTNFFPDQRDAKAFYKLIEKDKNHENKKCFYGVFSDYDDTPRRKIKGTVYTNNSSSYFAECLKTQIRKSIEENNEFIYINAWNEWGEGAYLEPDNLNGYIYLETIKKVIDEEMI